MAPFHDLPPIFNLPLSLEKTVTHILELFSDFSWSSVQFIGYGLLLFDVKRKEGLAEVAVYHVFDGEIVGPEWQLHVRARARAKEIGYVWV